MNFRFPDYIDGLAGKENELSSLVNLLDRVSQLDLTTHRFPLRQ